MKWLKSSDILIILHLFYFVISRWYTTTYAGLAAVNPWYSTT